MSDKAVGWARPSGRGWSGAAWVLYAVATIAALFTCVSQLQELSKLPVFFIFAAFPQLCLLASLLVSIVGGILAGVARSRLLATLGIIILFSTASAFCVSAIGRTSVQGPGAASSGGALRILSWNTDQQDVSQQQLHDLIEDIEPDVVVLPEYFPQVARTALSSVARSEGMAILGSDSSSATVLVSTKLGQYHLTDEKHTPAWAGFLVKPMSGVGASFLVAHLQRPSPASTATWAEHEQWVKNECLSQHDLIAVGDFNATNANMDDLGSVGCRDAAAALGVRSTGTWPTQLPACLGAAIDHVMATKNWKPLSYNVVHDADTAGSDHRPVFVVLRGR